MDESYDHQGACSKALITHDRILRDEEASVDRRSRRPTRSTSVQSPCGASEALVILYLL